MKYVQSPMGSGVPYRMPTIRPPVKPRSSGGVAGYLITLNFSLISTSLLRLVGSLPSWQWRSIWRSLMIGAFRPGHTMLSRPEEEISSYSGHCFIGPPLRETTWLRRPPDSWDHLAQETTWLRRPPDSGDHLTQETAWLRRPPDSGDHLTHETAWLGRPLDSGDHLAHEATWLRRPPDSWDHLTQETTWLRRPPDSGDHLTQETAWLRRPPDSGDHLTQETTWLRRPPDSGDRLTQETTWLRRPPDSGDHLTHETTWLRRPPGNSNFSLIRTFVPQDIVRITESTGLLNRLDYWINLHRNFDICSHLALIFVRISE